MQLDYRQGITRHSTMMQIGVIAFFAVLIGTDCASPNLKVRFDTTVFGIGSKAFIELPKSSLEAAAARWKSVTRPDGPAGLSSLQLWCPTTDHTTCVLFDDSGYIAGTQIGIEVSRLSNVVYDMTAQGYTLWNTTVNGVATSYWTLQQYFIDEVNLARSVSDRVSSRNPNKLLQHGAVWVTSFNGELYEIPDDVTAIAQSSDFTKQACLVRMGTHYYYNMTKESDCSSPRFPFTWFPLVDNGELIGLGFTLYAKMNFDSKKTLWFEEPNRLAVKIIVPNGPQCLYDLADSPGIVTMHTYYIDKPYLVSCLF